jgi:subtilisin family serine protease
MPRHVVIATVSLCLCLIASTAPAQEVVVWSDTFTRGVAAPISSLRQFDAPRVDVPFVMRLRNLGSRQTSSAVVRLNDEVVFQPADFSQHVDQLDRPVTLSLHNIVSVELRGPPASSLVVQILVDASSFDGPRILGVTPEPVGRGAIAIAKCSGLAADPKPRVFLGGVECIIQSWTDSLVFFGTPGDASSGPLVLESAGKRSLPWQLTISPLFDRPTISQQDLAGGFIAGRLVLEYRTGTLSRAELLAASQRLGFADQQFQGDLGYYLAIIPGASPDQTLAAYDRARGDPAVAWAMPVALLRAAGSPASDPEFEAQIHLHPEFLNLQRGLETYFPRRGAGVRIGILDTGLSPISKEVSAAEILDVVDQQGIPGFDEEGHGTAVATLAAGRVNDNCGVGVAPEAELVVARVARDISTFDVTDVANGMKWMLDLPPERRPRVINLSAGATDMIGQILKIGAALGVGPLEKQTRRAADLGVLLIACAGNDPSAGNHDLWFPASDDRWVAVGAITSGYQRRPDSRYGPGLDFVAHGGPIVVEGLLGTCEGTICCTSAAAPQFSGLAALLLGEGVPPDLVVATIRSRYIRDLPPMGRDDETGYGMIRLNTVDLTIATPANGSTLGGGSTIRPRAVIVIPEGVSLEGAVLEFFANGASLGTVPVPSGGTYDSPATVIVPNLLGAGAPLTVRAVLTEGPLSHRVQTVSESVAQVRFSPTNAFVGGRWQFEFSSVHDLGTCQKSRTGSGLLSLVASERQITMTAKDGCQPAERTCTYTGSIVFYSLRVNDLFNPVTWQFYFFLEKCLTSFSYGEMQYDILNIANPQPVLEFRNGDCMVRSELLFGPTNVSEIHISREHCGELTERVTLKRPPSALAEVSASQSHPVAAPRTGAIGDLWASSVPNPFNPRATIRYHVSRDARVSIMVFDAHGRRLALLIDDYQTTGDHEVVWDASAFPSGIYYYLLSADGQRTRGRLALLK